MESLLFWVIVGIPIAVAMVGLANLVVATWAWLRWWRADRRTFRVYDKSLDRVSLSESASYVEAWGYLPPSGEIPVEDVAKLFAVPTAALATTLGLPERGLDAGLESWQRSNLPFMQTVAVFEPNSELVLLPGEPISCRPEVAHVIHWNRWAIYQESDRDWVSFFGFAGREPTGCREHLQDLERLPAVLSNLWDGRERCRQYASQYVYSKGKSDGRS